MKKIAILLVAICLSLSALSQSASSSANSTMKLKSNSWDFGTIKEDEGVVTHIFEFTNTGKIPFVIENVATTCGCTIPKYSKEPILPSKTGYIEITYDPADRPGSFRRDVTILSNGMKNRNVITITGVVSPRPKSVTDEFPLEVSSGFRVSRSSTGLGYLPRGLSKSTTIEYINNSSKSITVGTAYITPEPYFTVSFPSKEIKSYARGYMTITYDLRKSDVWGRLINDFYLIIDGKKSAMRFSSTGIAADNFDSMSQDELDAAPRADLDNQYFNFGEVNHRTTHNKEFTFTNKGKIPLEIRNVKCDANLVTTLKAGVTIVPGASYKFGVTLNTTGLTSGRLTKSVAIMVNDPNRPMQEVRIAATVK